MSSFQFNYIFVAWLVPWAVIWMLPTWSSGFSGSCFLFLISLWQADQCVRCVIDQRLFITAPESYKLLFACRYGFAAHPEHGSKTWDYLQCGECVWGKDASLAITVTIGLFLYERLKGIKANIYIVDNAFSLKSSLQLLMCYCSSKYFLWKQSYL